jgi:hypothetical protein
MADLRIDLAAEFKGKKAFKEADKSVSSLDKAVGKLGKQVASVFAAQKIVAFGKASVKAFAEDQASAARLTKTIDNLGLAFANPAITQFIQKLSMQSGIVDENLRPAFQALLTTTGDVTKSMDLLTKAVDISRGSGVDLATVSQDLANGYVGITRGLKKYNLGLSQAQLKSKSFEEIMGLLNKQFTGASAAYLDTYAGKMAILNTAADNAKETIGKGLVDALISLGGEDVNIQAIATSMQTAADNTANFARGIGILVAKIKSIPGLEQIVKLFELSAKYSPAGLISNLGKPAKQGYGDYAGSTADFQRQQADKASAKASAAAEKKRLSLIAAQTKSQKTLTAEQRKQASLKKSGSVFDMQQIQLIAALKGTLSKEERTRVEAQLALLNDNDLLAAKLTKDILMAQDQTGSLYEYFLKIGDTKIKNPFEAFDKYIADLQAKLDSIHLPNLRLAVGQVPAASAEFLKSIASNYGGLAGAGQAGGGGQAVPSTNVPSEPMISYNPSTGLSYNANGAPTPVTITVTGTDALTQAIANSLQVQSLSGTPSAVSRNQGMFGP